MTDFPNGVDNEAARDSWSNYETIGEGWSRTGRCFKRGTCSTADTSGYSLSRRLTSSSYQTGRIP